MRVSSKLLDNLDSISQRFYSREKGKKNPTQHSFNRNSLVPKESYQRLSTHFQQKQPSFNRVRSKCQMSTHKKGKAFNRRDKAFKKKKKSGPLNKDWKVLKCKQSRASGSAKKPMSSNTVWIQLLLFSKHVSFVLLYCY